MKFSAAVVRIVTIGVLTVIAGFAAAQQAYPSKPIRFIVPYPAGGPASALARLVGQKMTESWGQPVIVDHRPGGNTVIGSEALAKSAPDGTPADVVRKLNEEINQILGMPELIERMNGMGAELMGGSVESFAAFHQKEFERWTAFIRATGAKGQ
jgi:tripartite-type tricarboxylate transporter receptor subunit TctC